METVETDCPKEGWGRRQSREVEAVCLQLPEFISFPQVCALLGPEPAPPDALDIQQCYAIAGPFSGPCRSLSDLHLYAQGPCLWDIGSGQLSSHVKRARCMKEFFLLKYPLSLIAGMAHIT